MSNGVSLSLFRGDRGGEVSSHIPRNNPVSRRTSKLLKKLAVGMETTSASLHSATARVEGYSPCSTASFDVEALLLVAYDR